MKEGRREGKWGGWIKEGGRVWLDEGRRGGGEGWMRKEGEGGWMRKEGECGWMRKEGGGGWMRKGGRGVDG